MSPNDLQKLLGGLDPDINRRGRQFEEICRWYLLNDPVYRAQLTKVWLWDDWPGCWGVDAGIDLVAEARDGHLWAVQSKAYAPSNSVTKADIDSFLSESARPEFSYRLLIATTDQVARLAERAMRAQEKPVGQLLLADLEQAELAWPPSPEDLRPAAPERKAPRSHQADAIDAVLEGFKTNDRGQLIMACGTGKTLVTLWLHERLRSDRTLVLVPSLSLLEQTVREWVANANEPFEFLPVCSDESVSGKDALVAHVADLGFPASGSVEEIQAFLARPGRRVVFSSYHSSPLIAEALTDAPPFNLVIADEAHRCAGRVEGYFGTVLDDEKIPARHRLFATATPRHFTGRVLKEASEADYELASMDDDARFGPVLHRLSFGEAIRLDLLSDYRVLVVVVDDAMCREYAEKGAFVTRDGVTVTDARTLASQIALAKAMRDYDLHRVLSFHSRVKSARHFADTLPEVIEWMPVDQRPSGDTWADHVSGTMNAGQRFQRLRRLRAVSGDERGVLSNARCLSEGVDVPNLDGVAFIDPKRSPVDIAQAVGRAIRKADDKSIGTIVIPVYLASIDDPDTALQGSAFADTWAVVRALREHDDDLAEQLDECRRSLGRTPGGRLHLPSKIVLDVPTRIGGDFVRAFETVLVERTVDYWEEAFARLQRFVKENGHADVPQSYADATGFKQLGSWCSNQRTSYRLGKLSEDRVRRLEELGFVWDRHEAAWEHAFARLQRFVKENGHLAPVRHIDETGFKLGFWCSAQRASYKSGKLSEDRVRRLEELGFVWDRHEAAWEDAFARLQRFVKENGHADVSGAYTDETGFYLGKWCNNQRASYKCGELSEDRVRRLEALEFIWDVLGAAWEEAFARLQRFVKENRHAGVAGRYTDETGFHLGFWCERQRAVYRRGELTEDRIQRLEELGFAWDPFFEAAWGDAFARLQRFVKENGHADVPQSYADATGFKLGIWCMRQRAVYRRGKLSEDRIQRLEELGFVWDSSGAAWEDAFARLQRFVKENGHADVPVSYTDETGFNLGTWCCITQRASYKSGKLSEDRVRRLEELGFVWDARGAAWEHAFARLQRFVKENGHLAPISHIDETGFKLGGWCSTQRRAYKSGKLAEDRIQRLEELGFVWHALDAAWEDAFARLQRFVKENGHADMSGPYTDETGFKLGGWCKLQRAVYRRGKLSEDRIQRLEAVGFRWKL